MQGIKQDTERRTTLFILEVCIFLRERMQSKMIAEILQDGRCSKPIEAPPLTLLCRQGVYPTKIIKHNSFGIELPFTQFTSHNS
jgi:hypothetical protein